MKFLLLIGIVLAVYFLWRIKQAPRGGASAPAKPTALTQDMVRCPVCSLHLPRGDAVPAPNGQFYCSAEHRTAAGN